MRQHQTISDSEHTVAARQLRHGRADLLRPVPNTATGEDVQIRSLGVYDTALGLVDDIIDGEVS